MELNPYQKCWLFEEIQKKIQDLKAKKCEKVKNDRKRERKEKLNLKALHLQLNKKDSNL